MKKDVLLPLASVHESARKILKGDFSYEIHYDYDTEMGLFCHDFEAMRDDLSIEIISKKIHFIFPDEILDLLLNGDKKRLSQVMYNLVSNSIKYSREEGIISIYFKKTGNYLKVYIKDTGIGISTADIPYIFNKFYRAEKCRNQNIPGSGLGLSISKYIVEAHGGFINCVESSLNGTIICFGLPI